MVFIVKPRRPNLDFPKYATDDSDKTIVERAPWFADGSDDEEATCRFVVDAVTKPVVTVPRPAPKRMPSEPTLPRVMVAPPSVPPPPADLIAAVSVPPAASEPPSLGPAIPPAPTWMLSTIPRVTIPILERKEHPSFGPVAFDLGSSGGTATTRRTIPAEGGSASRHVAIMLAAAAMTLLGWFGGRAFIGDHDSVTIAPASAVPTAVAFSAEPPPPASIAAPPESEKAPEQAPARVLTAQDLFPPAPSATVAAPAPRLTPAQLEENRRARARFAKDIANRNAPTPLITLPRTKRVAAPSLDDLVRTPRLRGEHD